MDEIVKLPPSTSGRPSSLRFVYDKLSVHVRGLKSLGVSAEQYGSLLISIVMSELPDDVGLQIARNTKEEIWKIEDLLETMKIEIRAREASEGNRVMPDSTKKPPLSNRPPFKPKETPTSSTFLSNQGLQGGQKFTIRCAYCEEFHYSASSPKVVDPANESTDVLSVLELGIVPASARRLKHVAVVTNVTISPSAIKAHQIKKPALPLSQTTNLRIPK